MKSLTVIQEEQKIMEEIIQFKTLRQSEDLGYFQKKKEALIKLEKKILKDVEYEILSQEDYVKQVQESLAKEESLLPKVKADKDIEDKEFEMKRIQKRIEIIKGDLEGGAEEEEQPAEAEQEEVQEKNKMDNSKVEDKGIKDDDIVLVEKKEEERELIVKKKESIKPSQQESAANKVESLILERLNEYKDAVKFFKKNDLIERETDAQDKVEKLKNVLERARKDIKSINLKEVPEKIKPEYIYGCSVEERKKQFMDIIEEFKRQRQEAKDQKAEFEGKIVKIEKQKLKKIKNEVAKKLEDFNKKVNSLENILKKLLELFKDEWAPAPITEIKVEEDKVEKVNEDVKENTMIIIIGKTSITDETASLKIHLSFENKILIEQFQNPRGGTFAYKTELDLSKFTKSQLKHIDKVNFTLEVLAKSCCLCPVASQGLVSLALNELLAKSEIIKKLTIPNYNQTIDVSLRLRQPLVEKEFTVIKHERVAVKKIIQTFKEKKVEDIVVEPPKQQNKSPDKKIEKKISVPVPKKIDENQKVSYDESDFSSEELKDPDCVANLISITVLKDRLKIMEEEYKKIEGRPPKDFRERLMRIRVQLKSLEKCMEEGAITPDAYVTKLNLQLSHDRKLLQYFKDKGNKEKAELILGRIQMMLNEIKELSA